MKHRKVKMTFDEYDALVEKLLKADDIVSHNYPPLEDLLAADEIDDKNSSILHYLILLSETLPHPVTEEQIQFRKKLNDILKDRLYLYDKEDLNDNNSGGKA